MKSDVMSAGREMSASELELLVYNWAYGQGLTPMHYDGPSDTWFMSDGEPYTTTIILREVEQNGSNNNGI